MSDILSHEPESVQGACVHIVEKTPFQLPNNIWEWKSLKSSAY